MEYGKIVSVTGLPGLYELINTKADGAIVRSLDDQTTRFISSRVHNFSHLESIEVYTTADNVNLVEVFEAMDKNGEKVPDEKDASGIKKYFEKIYGSIDFDRVYNSDMKKMIRWYTILKANNVEIKLTEPEPEPEVVEVDEPEPPKKEKAKVESKKKVEAPKKAEKVKAETSAKEKEKPAKKAAKTAESKSASKAKNKEETPKKAAKKTAAKSAKKK